MTLVYILDYGAGNLFSVKKALERLGCEVFISGPHDVGKKGFDALVLPGVGSFRETMEVIRPYLDELLGVIRDGTPTLGICLGMQVMFTLGTEGGLTRGLNLFKGVVVEFQGVRKPHMGWNLVEVKRYSPLTDGVEKRFYAYFAHSYHAKAEDERVVIGETEYGVRFPSIVGEGAVFGTQFHPEKSGRDGRKVLSNFVSVAKGAL